MLNQKDIDNVYFEAATAGYCCKNPIEYGDHKIYINEMLGLSTTGDNGETIYLHPSQEAKKLVEIMDAMRVIKDSLHLFRSFNNKGQRRSAVYCVSELNLQSAKLLEAIIEFQAALNK